MPIPPDWQPSPAGELEARRRGYEPAEIAAAFRAYHLEHGTLRADWDAAFLTWCRRETERDGERRQRHMMVPIAGGRPAGAAAPAPAPEEPEDPAAEIGDTPAAQWQRVRRALKRRIGPPEFRIWMAAAGLVGVVDGEVTLIFPTRFLCDHVRGAHGELLKTLWQIENPEVRRVELTIAAAAPRTGTG